MKKQILIYAMLFLALRAMSFAQYTDIHNFCCNEGGPPQPPGILAQGRDGNLYGSNGSRLFRIGPIGVQPLYAEFHTFNFGNLPERGGLTDRKSTRLNSSHLGISYAVFCLKKKKKNK